MIKSITDNAGSLSDRQENPMDRDLCLTEYERQVRQAHGLTSEGQQAANEGQDGAGIMGNSFNYFGS